ncbi:MAG: PIN domain-containing protein [Oscillospiraceae bacterium]|nr:PIN domain-containing protein [Oscillospiraceae bacterium]
MRYKVLIDTNVLLDYCLLRTPRDEDSRRVVDACRSGQIIGFVAAHSFPDIFYITRKVYSSEERRLLLQSILHLFQIVGLDRETIFAVITDEDFKDFEDCLIEKNAISIRADYILTWNTRDFLKSRIPAITPTEFLEK